MKNRTLALSLLLLCIITLLPFLGFAEFSTKGEPREAVVAMSMLNQDNWILPVNNGVDIPYKPPFFHWCIAALSYPQGYVSEFTSRLPSAISFIMIVVCGFLFFAKRKNNKVAVIAALLTLTSIEMHRSAIVCRVDMMLSAFIVGALMLFYKWYERGCRGMPVLAILCMSGAMFTKGPVGILLPSMVMGVFLIIRGRKFFPTFGKFAVFGLLACILPLMWYVAAYDQGGQAFLDLVREENIDRFLGKMSYNSHEHNLMYNFMTVTVGWLPWIILLVISLFSLTYHKIKVPMRNAWNKLRSADSLHLFVWLSFVLIFVFYCIPKSKRSVYLLPIYPFMAFLIAEYLVFLMRDKIKPFKIFAGFLAFVSMAVTSVFVFARCGMFTGALQGRDFDMASLKFFVSDGISAGAWAMILPCLLVVLIVSYSKDRKKYMRSVLVSLLSFSLLFALVFFGLSMIGPENMSSLGKNADFTLRQLQAIEQTDISFGMLLIMYLPIIVSFRIISSLCSGDNCRPAGILADIFTMVFVLFVVADGFFIPRTMNTRSDRILAQQLDKKFKDEQIYSYIPVDMLHFFGTNFYMGDKIKQFDVSRPEKGILMIAKRDQEDFFKENKDVDFTLVLKTNCRMTERKDIVYFYRFSKH